MVQFPINWTVNAYPTYNSLLHALFKLSLDNEWRLSSSSRGNPGEYLKPQSVRIERECAKYDVCVSWSLYLRHRGSPRIITGSESLRTSEEVKPVHNGRKFMESGCWSMELDFMDTTSGDSTINYCLEGVVNITPVSALLDGECRKCVDMKPLEDLSNDLGKLLVPETCFFSDVNLKCGDVIIPAHRNILSARSRVFAAMFQSPMNESRENEVVLDNLDVPVLRTMLAFLYTGQLSDLTVSSAADLLTSADQYLIQDLKRVCCKFLKDNISHENVLRILLLGERHCKDLKSNAVNYLCNSRKEFSDIERSEDWITMKEENTDLVIEILSSMVKVTKN